MRNKAASAPDAFTLKGDYAVGGEQRIIGGMYAYALYHNGADAADGNWYLRSVGYAPTAPLYQEYPKILLPLADLPTLRQRVGSRHWKSPAAPAAGRAAACMDDGEADRCAVAGEGARYSADDGGLLLEAGGLWMRTEASRGHYEAASSTLAAEYDERAWRLRGGVDGLVHDNDDGRLIAGVSAHYGDVRGDVESTYGSGSIRAQGYGVAGALTWYGLNGFYADAQAQATWLSGDITSSTTSASLVDGNDGFGYALGLEIGHKIGLGGKWSAIPQAQLVHTHLEFDDFTDPFDARISLQKGDSLRGRIGSTGEYETSWKAEDGTASRATLYGIANLYYEFRNGFHVAISDGEVTTRDDRLWGGLGLGGAYNWNDDARSVYGEISARTGLQNFANGYSAAATFGVRVRL